jgi:hypothetical protein
VAADGQVSGAQLAGQQLARGATVTGMAPAPGQIYIYLPQVSTGGH